MRSTIRLPASGFDLAVADVTPPDQHDALIQPLSPRLVSHRPPTDFTVSPGPAAKVLGNLVTR